MAATQKRGELAGLTSLRFFAALYVLLFHTRGGDKWFSRGFTGVTLFFVLSGFVLAYNYPRVGRGERKRFYVSRVARIYPLYVVAFLLGVPVFLHSIGPGHTGYMVASGIAFLLLVHTWYPPFHWVYNASAWTLAAEAFFYAIFPFAVAWVAKLIGARQQRWKLFVALFYVGVLLPAIYADLIWMRAQPARAMHIHHVFSLPVFHLCEFLIGIVFGLRFLHHKPVFRGGAVLAAVVFLVACLVVSTPLSNNRYDEFLTNGMFALPYALVIYTVAGWKSRVLAHPALQLGGEISFSIYLLQSTFIELIQGAFHHSQILLPLRFVLFLGCCYLTYRFVERPARSFILGYFHVKSHPKPIETPGMPLP